MVACHRDVCASWHGRPVKSSMTPFVPIRRLDDVRVCVCTFRKRTGGVFSEFIVALFREISNVFMQEIIRINSFARAVRVCVSHLTKHHLSSCFVSRLLELQSEQQSAW